VRDMAYRYVRLTRPSRLLRRDLKTNSVLFSQNEKKNSPKDDAENFIMVNGRKLSKKEMEFGLEPEYANTPYLYQPFILPDASKEKLPFWFNFHGIWGWGLAISAPCRIVKSLFLDFKYYGEFDSFKSAVEVNPKKRKHKILTATNHLSTIDDPLFISVNFSWPRCYMNPTYTPWSFAGHNILFTTKFLNWFFSHGRAIPIMRGQGIYQQGMDYLSKRCAVERGFFHNIYPEAKVNMFQTKLPLKWGLARLIQEEADRQIDAPSEQYTTPTIRVIWHVGIDKFLSPFRHPVKGYRPDLSKNIFKRNQHPITVNVGRSLDFSPLLDTMRKRRNKFPSLINFEPRAYHPYDEDQRCEERVAVMDLIDIEMDRMKLITEKLHAERLES